MFHFILGLFIGSYVGMVIQSLLYVAREPNWDWHMLSSATNKRSQYRSANNDRRQKERRDTAPVECNQKHR
jgi:hypothetical protein